MGFHLTSCTCMRNCSRVPISPTISMKFNCKASTCVHLLFSDTSMPSTIKVHVHVRTHVTTLSLSLFFFLPPPPSVGGSLPVLFPYNSEFIRNKYRGPYLGVQSTFWMVGRLLCGAFAWMIIPVGSIHSTLGSIQFHSWRLFIAISALPSILGALLYFILPESPRYLLEVGKERKAVQILERVYKINNLFRKDVPEFPVSMHESLELQRVDSKETILDHTAQEHLRKPCKRRSHLQN